MANVSTGSKKLNIVEIGVSIIKVSRPSHIIKNLALFAAIVFSGLLFAPGYLATVVWAFIAFSFATAATYIFNDIMDVKEDRNHPIKKNRPIATGKLPISLAIVVALIYLAISLFLSSVLSIMFLLTVIAYLLLQFGYSLGLKNIAVIDILIIASGFILRVYAGAVVIDAHLSVWFLLCVVSVALFLASGKRRAEFNILKSTSTVTRKSLVKYQKELLNSYVTMFGNAAWMSWALFSFFESPKATLPVWLFLAELSKTTTINKLLMATIPVVIFGIMRYQNLIFQGRSEAPEKLLLTDKALVISVLLWVVMVLWIFYGGVSIQGIQ